MEISLGFMRWHNVSWRSFAGNNKSLGCRNTVKPKVYYAACNKKSVKLPKRGQRIDNEDKKAQMSSIEFVLV